MGESYDDSDYRAPQYGMPTRHDRVNAQSGMDESFAYTLTKLGTWAAIAMTIFLVASGGSLRLP